MRRNLLFISVVFINFGLLVNIAFADSMRCKGKLISTGDTSVEVRMLCGELFEKEYVGSVRTGGKYVNLDRYTYLPNKGGFIKILDFHDGRLVRISFGRRVD